MKWIHLILISSTTFLLTACNLINFAEDVEDIDPPIVSGIEDKTIVIGTTFDPFLDVVSFDLVDGDVTDLLELEGNVNTNEFGTYFLKYIGKDTSGNEIEHVRYITVSVDLKTAENLVINGDFTEGMKNWTTTFVAGSGTANVRVVNEELVIEVQSVFPEWLWAPRIENIGMTFQSGRTYLVSFDARSEEDRSIHVQIGELLPADPWFIDFQPGNFKIHDLTNEMQTFRFTFRMDLDTNLNGAILFELGTVIGSVGIDHLLTTVYIDNIKIIEIG
ncbi:MAG: carbohydrate binding domain-containing protein [Bacilli bacterium]|nr:carbohydrate binding domain-containing protein [Bacilli bacterium]